MHLTPAEAPMPGDPPETTPPRCAMQIAPNIVVKKGLLVPTRPFLAWTLARIRKGPSWHDHHRRDLRGETCQS